MTDRKKLLSLILIAFLVLVLPIALMLSRQRQEIRKQAADYTGVSSGNLRVTPATAVVGQTVDVYFEDLQATPQGPFGFIQGKLLYDKADWAPVGVWTPVVSAHKFWADGESFIFGANSKDALLSGQILKLTLRALRATTASNLSLIDIDPDHKLGGIKSGGAASIFGSGANGINVGITTSTPTAIPTPGLCSCNPVAKFSREVSSCSQYGTSSCYGPNNTNTTWGFRLENDQCYQYRWACGITWPAGNCNCTKDPVSTTSMAFGDPSILNRCLLPDSNYISQGETGWIYGIANGQYYVETYSCGGAGSTSVPTPTPTATVVPAGPATFTLVPASNTVGSNPVLIEIRLNSGGIAISSAQAVILVDSKLNIVDSSGTNSSAITSVSTFLTNTLGNTVSSNTIKFTAAKAGPQTSSQAVNETIARFYVKTFLTSGAATLSFKTGQTLNDSLVLTDDAENILGTANPLTLTLGIVATPTPTTYVQPTPTPTTYIQPTPTSTTPSVQGANLKLSPATGTYNVKELFGVNVLLDTAGASTSGTDFILSWSPASALEVRQVSDISYGTSPLFVSNTPTVDNINGKIISISTMSSAANIFSGKGTLATIIFNAKSAGTVNFRFECSTGSRSDSNIWSQQQDIINCGQTSGAVFTISQVAGGVPGDTNGNGCVGIADLGQVALNFRGPSSCTPNDAARTEPGPDSQGDFNHDGCVNYMDFAIVASSRFSNACIE